MPGTVQQFIQFFNSLTLGRKVSLALLLSILVAGGYYVSDWAQRPEYQVLYSKLDADDANQIIEKLREQKIPYQVGGSGDALLVPSERVHELRLHLASAGLPPQGRGRLRDFRQDRPGDDRVRTEGQLPAGAPGGTGPNDRADLGSRAGARPHRLAGEVPLRPGQAARPGVRRPEAPSGAVSQFGPGPGGRSSRRVERGGSRARQRDGRRQPRQDPLPASGRIGHGNDDGQPDRVPALLRARPRIADPVDAGTGGGRRAGRDPRGRRDGFHPHRADGREVRSRFGRSPERIAATRRRRRARLDNRPAFRASPRTCRGARRRPRRAEGARPSPSARTRRSTTRSTRSSPT